MYVPVNSAQSCLRQLQFSLKQLMSRTGVYSGHTIQCHTIRAVTTVIFPDLAPSILYRCSNCSQVSFASVEIKGKWPMICIRLYQGGHKEYCQNCHNDYFHHISFLFVVPNTLLSHKMPLISEPET